MFKNHPTLREYQDVILAVYGISNQKHFTANEMLTNVNRFAMRGLKGIRKGDLKKAEINLIIAASWMLSLANQLGLDLEDFVWTRFPYHCSYCGGKPCACKKNKVQKRITLRPDSKERPRTLEDIQKMFRAIYPPQSRTLEHAGIHLGEEVGELSEAVLKFRTTHEEKDYERVGIEAADAFSCFMGVFNSMNVDYEKEVVRLFDKGCHVCKSIPCACPHASVLAFKS